MDYNSFSKPKMVANVVGAVICYILFAYELHGRIQDHSSITSSLLFLYFAVNCTFRVISFARLKRKKKSLTDEKALLKAEHRQGLVLNIFNNATAALLLLIFMIHAITLKETWLTVFCAASVIAFTAILVMNILNLRKRDA